MKILLVVIAVVLVGGAYVVLTYGSLPLALISAHSLNQSTLASAMLHKVSTMPKLNMSYSGDIIVNNTDPGVVLTILKYYNYSKSVITFTDLPSLGNVTTIVMHSGNGTIYSCIRAWQNITQYSDPNNRYICSNMGRNMSNISGLFALVTLTAVNKVVDTSSLRNLNISSYSLSSWNGQPCYFVSGSGSADINGALVNQTGFVPSNFTFDTCVSAQYDVPLEFNAVASAAGKFVHIDIVSTGIGTASTQNEVSSLPTGAVVV